jgi:transposase
MQGTADPTGVQLLDAAALCRHLVEEGSVYAFLADHRRDLFPDELFADLFPSGRGRPSVPADQVATVMVLQALEGLSDREAAAQLRRNIAWKVACGLALTDQGFHPTVLTLWRSRLRASGRPERIFEAVRQVVAATGVLKGRQRRALDSTLLDDAVATQDTVTQLVGAIRRVRRLVTLVDHHDGWDCLNQAGSGPGVSNEGRLVWRSPSSVTGLHPQTPALRIGHLPGPVYSLRRRSSESALLSSLLAVDQPATSSAASSSMPGTCLREPPCPGH